MPVAGAISWFGFITDTNSGNLQNHLLIHLNEYWILLNIYVQSCTACKLRGSYTCDNVVKASIIIPFRWLLFHSNFFAPYFPYLYSRNGIFMVKKKAKCAQKFTISSLSLGIWFILCFRPRGYIITKRVKNKKQKNFCIRNRLLDCKFCWTPREKLRRTVIVCVRQWHRPFSHS